MTAMTATMPTPYTDNFDDSGEGAIAFARAVGLPFDLADARTQPDPWVAGVWRVVLKGAEFEPSTNTWRMPGIDASDPDPPVAAFIVFLAGYPDPFGQPRPRNDFDW